MNFLRPFSSRLRLTTAGNKLLCSIVLLLNLTVTMTGRGHAAGQPEKGEPAVGLRLVAADWDFRTSNGTKNARVQWPSDQPDRVSLSLSAGEGGQAYLVSRRTLPGDFTAEIGINLSDWNPPRGGVAKLMVGAALPDGQLTRRTYLLVREARWTKDYPEDYFRGWFVDSGKFTFLPMQDAQPQERFMKLRLQRQKDTLTACRYMVLPNPLSIPTAPPLTNQPVWVEVARFAVPSEDPLLLALGISNTEKNKSLVFPAVSAAFSEFNLQAAAGQETGKKTALKGEFEELQRSVSKLPEVHTGQGPVLYRDELREADDYYRRGLVLAGQQKWAEAEKAHREAARIDPKNAEYQLQVGTDCAWQGKWDEALFYFNEAVALNPDNPISWNALGGAYYNLQRYEQAVMQYRTAIRLNPSIGEYHANLAGAYLALGKRDEAMKEAQEARRLGFKGHWVYKELGML